MEIKQPVIIMTKISQLTEKDVLFLEKFETKSRQYQLLESIKPNLTDEGLEAYNRLKKWIDDNVMKYLEIL